MLAGGSGRRFGGDKLAARLDDGRTVLEHTVERLTAVTDRVILLGSARGLGLDAVPDAVPDEGPLVALAEGLARRPIAGTAMQPATGPTHLASVSDAPFGLLVGGDMPWLRPALLRLLLDRLVGSPDDERAVLAALRDGGQVRPLPLAFRPAPLGRAAAGLVAGGERRLRSLLAAVPVVAVEEPDWRAVDPTGDSLRDIDRPSDLAPR